MRSVYFEVQEATESASSVGGSSVSWSTVFRMVGSMKALRGGEQLRGLQMEAKATHRVTTWYDSRVTAAHRLKYGSRYFNILFVDNVEELGRRMTLLVSEVK